MNNQKSIVKQNIFLGLLVVAVFLFWPQLSAMRENFPRPVPAAPTAAPMIIYVAPPPAATLAPAPQTVIIPDSINSNEVSAPVGVSASTAAELQAVTVALETSQKVASACLEAWVQDAKAGRLPESCTGILKQVQDLTFRHYQLTYGGK